MKSKAAVKELEGEVNKAKEKYDMQNKVFLDMSEKYLRLKEMVES